MRAPELNWNSMLYRADSITIFLIIMCTGFAIEADAQYVEIQGKAKVSVMDTANAEDLIVVKQADGTLATRQVSSLPPDQPDTVRTYATDIELNKLLCTCGNEMKPFLVKSSLAKGYSVLDLFEAGVPTANLIAGGASCTELLAAGATPLDIYNGGLPQDSLLGKTYQGGLIFYLDTQDTLTGVEGMVSAPSNQSDGVNWQIQFATLTNATGLTVGTGQANTDSIIATDGIGDYAAYICDTLLVGGYDDWFLPSRDEINLMYLNLHTAALGSFSTDWYWSSSEIADDAAFAQSFINGAITDFQKFTPLKVRAVRTF